jgi:signal transduction histidine kinase
MRRLYFQIYLTVLASLVLFGFLVASVWWFASGQADDRNLLTGAEALALELLPGPERPVPELQDKLTQIQAMLPFALSVHDAEGTRMAIAGGDMPEFPFGRRSSGRYHAPGFGVVWVLELDDGRWMLARPLHPRAPPAARLAALLLLLALAVGLASYPLVRRTTRRLERLQQRVESLGAGDLSARVKVEGRDEVAALARSFNQAAEQIERLMGSHKALLANASHELRTPLTRLRMHLEMLGSEADPVKRAEAQQDIAELDHLVGEILLASRLDAGAGEKPEEIVDLLALLAEECARTGAELSGTPAQVRGEPDLLRRLFRNLLENAARYGGRQVQVVVATRGEHIEARVCDRGPGVPEPERERIFEPFYRPPSAAEAVHGGAGLGLALVRQIAERHGGSVRCRGRDGGGSCFVVTLNAASARHRGA